MNRLSACMASLGFLALTLNAGCVIGGGSWSEPQAWVESTQELEIPLLGIDTFAAKTHNGRIQVDQAAAGGTARAVVHIKAGGRDEADAQECLDAVSIKSETHGSTHLLTSEWNRLRRDHWQATVNYEVHLPEGIALRAETHNGRITVEGLHEPCDLQTHNGRITVSDVTGELKAVTHNGPIDVQGTGPRIHLESHNGSIEAKLAGVSEIDGAISTHNGSVKLALGQSASTRLQCHTHNGRIRATVPLNEVTTERRSLEGTVGGGAGSLAITTHNGGITITK